MKAEFSAPVPIANRWYDRVFRFWLCVVWALMAWYLGFISQLMVLMEVLKDGRMIKLFTLGSVSFSIGSKMLKLEWTLVLMIFMWLLLFIMAVVPSILLYKGLRWLCCEREAVRIINFKSPVFLWAILLTWLFGGACWLVYSFAEGARGRIEFEVYVLMTSYSALLVFAGLWGGLLLRRQPRFVRMVTCVVVTLLMAYSLPFRAEWLGASESAPASSDVVENKTASEW